MNPLSCTDDFKRLLKLTWIPFFSQFKDLTPVQRQAIPLVLAQKNLIISAPLASGKTEAVCAPLLEILIQMGFRDFSILYVVPTKALVNDLYRRLEEPVKYMGLNIERKTGDYPRISMKKPPFLLITTPESLDSLLSRNPQFFETLKAIILDDLHLVDGTYRGDQLRVLLERLKLLKNGEENLRFYILSATIHNPELLGSRYVRDFETIDVMPSRDMEFYLVPFQEHKTWQNLFRDWVKKGFRKILIFCQTKKEAEDIASALRKELPHMEPILVHHAGLSKRKRVENEEILRKRREGICVATTTLEIGIDIGDMDAVCLNGPPHSVSSLLQRIGRGSRKKDVIYGYGICRDTVSKALFEILAELAQHLELEDKEGSFDLSVVIQQIFSYLHQRRRVGTSLYAICRLFRPFGTADQTIIKILDNLLDKGYVLKNDSGLYFTGDRTERLIEYGGIHANLPNVSQGDIEVVNYLTNEVIGYVEKIIPQFTLAGRYWEVAYVLKKRIFVKEIEAPSGLLHRTPFDGHSRLFLDFPTAVKLRSHIFGGYLEDYEIPFSQNEGFFFVFHFLGLVYGEILKIAMDMFWNLKIRNVDGLFFIIEGADELMVYRLGKISMEDLLSVLKSKLNILGGLIQLGRFFPLLPYDIKWQELLKHIKIVEFHEFLGRVRFKRVNEEFMKHFL